MNESTKAKEFRLPEICRERNNKNSAKERELIDSVSSGNMKKMYDILWNEPVSLDVKKDYYGTDLLSLATQNDQNEMVKLLMRMNLEPNCKNNYGATPIHWAANNGNDYLIRELCKHGLTIKDLEKRDEFGSTPLHFAALKNNESIVHLLISSGINPTVINNDGKRASDVTTDISIKKYLKEEENRYMAEHFKKKPKKKGKKKSKNKSGTPLRRTSASTASSRKSISSMSKRGSTVSSYSQIRASSSSVANKGPPSNKRKETQKKKNILPPTIYNNKPIVSAKEEVVVAPQSYAMRNLNQEILNIENLNKNLINANSLKGSDEKLRNK